MVKKFGEIPNGKTEDFKQYVNYNNLWTVLRKRSRSHGTGRAPNIIYTDNIVLEF